jgi:hypothetical protein
MRRQLRFVAKRAVLLVVGVAFVLGALDGGSVALTRLQLPDDVKTAGYAAAEVSSPGPTDRQTAVAAWKAAEQAAEKNGFTVPSHDFTIYPDGRVQLTGSREAPTFLLHRVRALQHLALVTSTQTVKALPFTSSPQLLRRTR